MRSKVILIALASSLAACNTPDVPDKGVATVNVPVVSSADYVFDASAPDGALAAGETDRLNGWFQGLGLGYGDTIYVDGPYVAAARGQISAVAGQYGMMVSEGAPVTTGIVQPGFVRVVVSRRRASVPGCPNWSVASQPNFENRTMSNYGCGVEFEHRCDGRQPRGPRPRARSHRHRRCQHGGPSGHYVPLDGADRN